MFRVETEHIEDTMLWSGAGISPIYDYRKFSYVKQGVTEEELEYWASLGYDQRHVKSFTGSMYDNSNPMPDWLRYLENRFGLYNQTYTFYRMDTLEIMPVHSDHFRTYCRLNNVTPDKVYRVVVMLEDWKPGHYFELDGIGYTNWKAGDWFKWRGDVPHSAANIGVEPRYTLQITGLSIHQGQLNKLFVFFDIPNYQHPAEVKHPMITNVIAPIVKQHKDRKVMIYMDNGYIKQLDSINHTSTDPIHIYLYEPLCSYDVTNPFDRARTFYGEFNSDVDYNNLRADELDSIYNYAVRNNLKVVVHTGDYNADKYYPYYNSHLELICDDLFLSVCTSILDLNEDIDTNFTKKFINLNWRHTNHRQLTSLFLAEQDGYLSWYFDSDFDMAKQKAPFDLAAWETKHPILYQRLQNGNKLLNINVPYMVDIDAEDKTTLNVSAYPEASGYQHGSSPALFNKNINSLEKYYRDVFVDIVTESRYGQPTGNFSEKVLQAIQYQKPFILVAPPYTLEYLRSYGFKTFSDFWDESYDTETDHGERLAKIFYVIDEILDKPITELREIYKQMIPIVKHNLETFKNVKWNTV